MLKIRYAGTCLAWRIGMLKISELWKSAETGTEARWEKIERWLQSTDEFGMNVFLCL